jgi:hypothetical protein
MSQTAEQHQSLWLLAASPIVWAAHLLLCYSTAAVWCAKLAGPDQALWEVRVAIAAYTAIALVVIGIVGWGRCRNWRDRPAPHT